MTLEQTLASALCGGAELAWRKRIITVGSFAGPRMEQARQLLRWAGAVAVHYDLLPERTEPDDEPDEQ